MRNFVAKNDFNRSSVHTDQKKAWEPDILDGIEEHYIEINSLEDDDDEMPEDFDPQAVALTEYARGVKASGILD